MMRHILSVSVLLIVCSWQLRSQVIITSAFRDVESTSATARNQDISLTLPFWDDFSDVTTNYASGDLWLFGKSAWVNTGMGIDPPSLRVATLDGLDSLGKPYNINDILAKGFADKMVSHPIRLDLVDASLRSTVFISFYYQFQGRGEAPDPGDILSLSFKTQTGTWERVWSVENDGTLNKNVFVQVLVPINADRFFHDNFQFRFQNFGRLSGPYDSWNLDYIYLNKGRSSFDNSYPDRSITTPFTSLFKNYQTLPIKHFLINPSANISAPSFGVYNFRIGNNQPLNYFSNADIKTFKAGVESTINLKLDDALDIGSLIGLQRKNASLNTLPPLSAYDAEADSIEIKINLSLTTKDNDLEGPPDNGDYDPAKYSPINFKKNDLLSGTYFLKNYYAYDDGSAEYGAGLNQPGAQLAYQYDMITTDSDTIVAFDVYFPRFGDETNQVIQLMVWRDLNGSDGTILHEQSFTVNRSAQSKFVRVPLTNIIGVKDKFFIGWKQSSAAIIAVGLDKSSDSGNKVFFNTRGVWEQNLIVAGNLMMRPVFGKGKGSNVVTDIREEEKYRPYPNPNQGVFQLPINTQNIQIIDLKGRLTDFESAVQGQTKVITLQNFSTGLHVVKYLLDNRHVITKVLVYQ